MSCQKEIQEYWNARSGDFSEISREELESPSGTVDRVFFRDIAPSGGGEGSPGAGLRRGSRILYGFACRVRMPGHCCGLQPGHG